MALGTGSLWPTAIDTDATLGPTSGIIPGITHLGDTGVGQGDQLGITKNLIQGLIANENVAQLGGLWCVSNGTYIQPAIGSTVVVTVYVLPYGTTPFSLGMIVYIQNGAVSGNVGGLYLVTLVGSSTSITLMNLGGLNNSIPGTVMPTASVIQFVGWSNQGPADQVALYEREWNKSESSLFSSTQPNQDWTFTAVAGGVFSLNNTAATATALNTPSLWQLGTGTGSSTGASVLACKNIFIPSLTPLDIAFSVSLPVLSNGTDTYVFGCGISTSSTAVGTSPFMGIVYQQSNSTVWNASAGASYTSNLSASAVAVTANVLYHLRMTLNAGWSSMTIWINHGSPVTVTTNLQTGQMFPVLILASTASVNSKLIYWARTKLRLFLPR